MTKPVLTKVDFVRRYAAGEFGNASPTWNTIEEWLKSGYRELVHVRNRVAGGLTWYNVAYDCVIDTFKRALVKGCPPEQLYISAMCPTEKTLFQGEVQQSERGLDLHYTTVAKPMRDALKEWSKSEHGATAAMMVEYYLCPNSLEWLQHLLREYPNHVIEFTTLSVNWGTLPGYNTIFWECRAY